MRPVHRPGRTGRHPHPLYLRRPSLRRQVRVCHRLDGAGRPAGRDRARPRHRSDHLSGLAQQFDLLRAADTTMRSGSFRRADMVGFWKAAIAGVMNAGRYQRVRAASETAVSLRDLPDWREVVRHESDINRMLSLYPQVLLCLYDLEKVGGSFLVDLMSMHHRLLINGRLTENPYYLAPDEWLARQSGPLDQRRTGWCTGARERRSNPAERTLLTRGGQSVAKGLDGRGRGRGHRRHAE